jgi:hypothetical protein
MPPFRGLNNTSPRELPGASSPSWCGRTNKLHYTEIGKPQRKRLEGDTIRFVAKSESLFSTRHKLQIKNEAMKKSRIRSVPALPIWSWSDCGMLTTLITQLWRSRQRDRTYRGTTSPKPIFDWASKMGCPKCHSDPETVITHQIVRIGLHGHHGVRFDRVSHPVIKSRPVYIAGSANRRTRKGTSTWLQC